MEKRELLVGLSPSQVSGGFLLKIIMQIQYAQTLLMGTLLLLSSAKVYNQAPGCHCQGPIPREVSPTFTHGHTLPLCAGLLQRNLKTRPQGESHPSPAQSWLTVQPSILAQWGLEIRTLTLKKARHPTPFLCSSLLS